MYSENQNYSNSGLPEVIEYTRLKNSALELAQTLSMDTRTFKDSLQIKSCAEALQISYGNTNKPVIRTWFCKHRSCPICQWRKKMQRIAQGYAALNHLKAKQSGYRWLFLTLTVQNCHVQDLSSTLQMMQSAFSKMTRRLEFSNVKGYFRMTEITPDQNHPDYLHPHYHCLLLVTPSMFAGNQYVKRERWGSLWQESLEACYTPMVHVRGIGRYKSDEEREVINHLAYSLKSLPMNLHPQLQREVTLQVKGKRLFGSGGELRGILQEDEPDSETEIETTANTQQAVIGWWNQATASYAWPSRGI